MEIGKIIMKAGVFLTVTGFIIYFGGRYVNFGHLFGDFSYEGDNFRFYFPLASSIIISIVLTVIINLFRQV